MEKQRIVVEIKPGSAGAGSQISAAWWFHHSSPSPHFPLPPRALPARILLLLQAPESLVTRSVVEAGQSASSIVTGKAVWVGLLGWAWVGHRGRREGAGVMKADGSGVGLGEGSWSPAPWDVGYVRSTERSPERCGLSSGHGDGVGGLFGSGVGLEGCGQVGWLRRG